MIGKIKEELKKRGNTQINLNEFVEAKIWENGILKETKIFKGNTVTATGKAELTELVGGTDNKTIDTMWAKIGGAMTAKTSINSRDNNTLSVLSSSAYTITGNYSAVFTGNAGLGTLNHYNSIAINVDLLAGSEISFTMYWVFSGEGAGYFGSEICASRLGKIGDVCDAPLSSIGIFLAGVEKYSESSNNSVSNNTLTLSHDNAISGTASVFDGIMLYTNATTAYRFWDKYTGFTVTPSAYPAETYVVAQLTFG